jgi:hypothetical protein
LHHYRQQSSHQKLRPASAIAEGESRANQLQEFAQIRMQWLDPVVPKQQPGYLSLLQSGGNELANDLSMMEQGDNYGFGLQ